MDFRFTEDQQSIQELSRKIFETEVSEDSWKELEKSGNGCTARFGALRTS